MLEALTAAMVAASATASPTPRASRRANSVAAASAITTPQHAATAATPLQRQRSAKITSLSHSQANHGCPGAGKGEGIRHRYSSGGQHQFPGADVPAGVAVRQQRCHPRGPDEGSRQQGHEEHVDYRRYQPPPDSAPNPRYWKERHLVLVSLFGPRGKNLRAGVVLELVLSMQPDPGAIVAASVAVWRFSSFSSDCRSRT